ncbi:hypothetical protein C0674_10525 [Sporolactobacillus terrae]|uniref:Uncharacterized protein n=1 Tax=Sporolactobacillus terrae TaxID=269673 RepID=A0ABX5Q8T5_9BACL|nr:hypothetical protein C0674_10525 [Sporolactobacillus terrae]QAA25997.1 hypothetical protein C0679_10505 [Sporolactobacillus terrae]
MTFALHTGRTFTGCDDFRVAYRTYAHLAKVPLGKFLHTCVMDSCLFGAESSLRLLACRGRTASLLRQGKNLRGRAGTHQQGAIPQAPKYLNEGGLDIIEIIKKMILIPLTSVSLSILILN